MTLAQRLMQAERERRERPCNDPVLCAFQQRYERARGYVGLREALLFVRRNPQLSLRDALDFFGL